MEHRRLPSRQEKARNKAIDDHFDDNYKNDASSAVLDIMQQYGALTTNEDPRLQQIERLRDSADGTLEHGFEDQENFEYGINNRRGTLIANDENFSPQSSEGEWKN